MAIRVSYTPYGAVGGLAEHAGQAQQAVRDQQIAEQIASQERGIAAQKEMQATQIGASREEWQKKLAAQQEQFAAGQALQQEQIFRQQQAREFATMKQSQGVNAQLQAQQERFKQEVGLKERAFELQEAQETRLTQSVQANVRAQEMKDAFNLTALKTTKEGMAQSLADWEKLQGVISPEEYVAGTIAISQGKVPKVAADTDALIAEQRRLNIEKKQRALVSGLSDRGRVLAQNAFTEAVGDPAHIGRGLFSSMSKTELLNAYKKYQALTGYVGKTPAGKKELDTIYDIGIKSSEDYGWFDYYSEWDPNDPEIKKLRGAIKSKGPLTRSKANEFVVRARQENPNKSESEIRPLAENIARNEGYEF